MSDYQCSCGFQAEDPDQMDDHLGLSLIPDDDVGPDGQIHAEAASRGLITEGALMPSKACTCGFTGRAAEIDAHLLFVFEPNDGANGNKHAAIGATAAPAPGQDAAPAIG